MCTQWCELSFAPFYFAFFSSFWEYARNDARGVGFAKEGLVAKPF
jgi:hypothetical protein